MTQSTKPPERVFRAICTNGVSRIRTRATVGLKTDGRNTHCSRASAPFTASPAALLPGWGNWRTTIEHTQTQALVVRRFISRGLLLICNFCRPTRAAGKLFTFRALVHDANQSAGRVFHAFQVSPVHSAEPLFLGLVALSDGHRDSERKLKCPTNLLKGKSR